MFSYILGGLKPEAQGSHVTGGEDSDVYHIATSGGRAIINNFAHDQEMDTLFLNVSHSSIVCSRDEWDLLIKLIL